MPDTTEIHSIVSGWNCTGRISFNLYEAVVACLGLQPLFPFETLNNCNSTVQTRLIFVWIYILTITVISLLHQDPKFLSRYVSPNTGRMQELLKQCWKHRSSADQPRQRDKLDALNNGYRSSRCSTWNQSPVETREEVYLCWCWNHFIIFSIKIMYLDGHIIIINPSIHPRRPSNQR